ncbi:phosphoglycerate kinase [soil metagenome]
MAWRSLDDMELAGKVVLCRVDVNMPVESGRVTDATRIQRVAPSIRAILGAGGKPVLLAHFDRPKGKVVPEMSLRVVLPAMEAVLGVPVRFAEDCVGDVAASAVAALPAGAVLVLENTRFHPGEEANEPAFAAALAALGDVSCNDAFSAAHRAHASTDGIARLMPSCAGRAMQAELDALERALGAPERPVVAVVGGAKVSTKLAVLDSLIAKADMLVIGGAMANTFLLAQGHAVGKSLVEAGMAGTARDILAKAEGRCAVVLPVDIVVARAFEAGSEHRVVPAQACPDDMMILDAGPQSVERIKVAFDNARTLLWNGPLGAFEVPPFNAATDAAAAHAAKLTRAGRLLTVAGGGDTVAALNASGAAAAFSYVSTAGGAFLEWLEGKTLPGVAALTTDEGDRR